MPHNEGINICKQVVEILLSEKDLEDKAEEGFMKIAHLGIFDASYDHFKEVIMWCEKYRKYKKFELKLDGNFDAKDIELKVMATELKNICDNIIKNNI
ncbi:MAG: hypothetical protein V4556_13260 [Bacteroidota bacterium]